MYDYHIAVSIKTLAPFEYIYICVCACVCLCACACACACVCLACVGVFLRKCICSHAFNFVLLFDFPSPRSRWIGVGHLHVGAEQEKITLLPSIMCFICCLLNTKFILILVKHLPRNNMRVYISNVKHSLSFKLLFIFDDIFKIELKSRSRPGNNAC